MPVLPVIDLLILAGSGGLVSGFILKVIWVTTNARPTLLGFTPLDVLIMSAVLLALALVLAARTWVKHKEKEVYGGDGEKLGDPFAYRHDLEAQPPAAPTSESTATS